MLAITASNIYKKLHLAMKYPACNMTNTASNIYLKLYLAMKYIIILPIGIDKSPQEFVGNKINEYIYIYHDI